MHLQTLDNKIIHRIWNYLLGFKQITNSELCFSSQWKCIEKDRKVLQAWNVSLYVTIVIWVSEYYSLHCKLWEFVFINCNWELKERAKTFVFLKKFLNLPPGSILCESSIMAFQNDSSQFYFCSFWIIKIIVVLTFQTWGTSAPRLFYLKKRQCSFQAWNDNYIKNM